MTSTQIKKPPNERAQRKIDLLRQLIDHERTSEDERDAARRALQRFAEAYKCTPEEEEGTMGPGLLHNPGAWEGKKYRSTQRLALTEIATLIRADLKVARKVGRASAAKAGDVAILDPIGDAPRGIKFSVRTRNYAGGGSIDVTIKGVPEGWGWTWQPDRHSEELRKTATPAMAALAQEVKRIHQAYNYDNSDLMTDYFASKYLGSVSTEDSHVYTTRL